MLEIIYKHRLYISRLKEVKVRQDGYVDNMPRLIRDIARKTMMEDGDAMDMMMNW